MMCDVFRVDPELLNRTAESEQWDIGLSCLRCLRWLRPNREWERTAWGPLLEGLTVYLCDPCLETSDAPYDGKWFDYRWGDVIQQVARDHPERFRDKDREMILSLPHYTEGNSDGTDPSIVGKR